MNRPLYRPTPRQAIGLAVVALAALSATRFVMRYWVIRIARSARLRNRRGDWSARAAASIALFQPQVFGLVALGAARAQLAPAVARPVRGDAARGRLRHRALQRRAVVACGRGADPQPGASRVRSRLRASAASVAANHSACQLAKRLVPDDEDRAEHEHRGGRRLGQRLPAGRMRAPSGRSGRTARPRRSSAQTESRGSADRTTAPSADWIASTVSATSSSAERKRQRIRRALPRSAETRGETPAGVRDAASAAAPATGASIATAAKASERSQPPMPRLSIGMFATVQPINTPATRRQRDRAPRCRRDVGAGMPCVRRAPPSHTPRRRRTRRQRHAADRLPEPVRMVRHRRAPDEFRLARDSVVEQAPVAADRAFELALPRLVVRLDQVDAEILALGARRARRAMTRAWLAGDGSAPSRMRPALGQPNSPIMISLPGKAATTCLRIDAT